MIGVLFIWSLVGAMLLAMVDQQEANFINPMWIYQNVNVNMFGTLILTVLFNLICPIYSIGYWFYKLCTVGRDV